MKKALVFSIIFRCSVVTLYAHSDSIAAQAAKEYYEFSKQNLQDAKHTETFLMFLFSTFAIMVTGITIFTRFELKKKIKEQDNIIARLKETEQWAENLRETSRVVVLQKKGKPISIPLGKVLNQNIFKQLTFKYVNEIESISYGDIVFINDEDGALTGKEDNNAIDLSPLLEKLSTEVFVFYFNDNRKPLKLEVLENKHLLRLATANFHSQVYGNLMNLIKVRDLILKQKL